MGILVRLLPAIVVVGLIVWLVRTLIVNRERKLKCWDCVHCGKLFHDGSLCGYRNTETFKTVVHVENCVDHEPR
jgi:hypothetical protein